MVKKYKYLAVTALIGLSTLKTQAQVNIPAAFKFAEKQTDVLLSETEKAKAQSKNPNQVLPRSINPDGSLALISSKDWCSGFFPGELWFLYQYTKDAKWLN